MKTILLYLTSLFFIIATTHIAFGMNEEQKKNNSETNSPVHHVNSLDLPHMKRLSQKKENNTQEDRNSQEKNRNSRSKDARPGIRLSLNLSKETIEALKRLSKQKPQYIPVNVDSLSSLKDENNVTANLVNDDGMVLENNLEVKKLYEDEKSNVISHSNSKVSSSSSSSSEDLKVEASIFINDNNTNNSTTYNLGDIDYCTVSEAHEPSGWRKIEICCCDIAAAFYCCFSSTCYILSCRKK